MSVAAEPLLLLLNAKNRDTVDDILSSCFRFRHDGVPKRKISAWTSELEIKEDQTVELVNSATSLIRECLFKSALPAEILPADFHPQLLTLITKIVRAHAAEWRQSCLNNMASPPKLVNYDWRVSTKVASDSISRMNDASLQLSLQIQENPTTAGVMAPVKTMQLELSRQELATMLDGLTKIRDQLGSIK